MLPISYAVVIKVLRLLLGAIGVAYISVRWNYAQYCLDTDGQVPLQVDVHGKLAKSPPHYPSPWMNPDAAGWEDAYAKAKAFVTEMTLVEKVNLTTGTG